MNSEQQNKIQALIGYEFNDSKFLVAAFTHSSYVNEHPAVGNERIEFLGDCVLDFLVGEKLFLLDRTASEKVLTQKRASVVAKEPLARIVDELGLLQFLRVGAGVDKNTFEPKARSDVFEALLGAVYLDGGMNACREVLDNIFYNRVIPEFDYISELYKYCAKHGIELREPYEENGDFVAKVEILGKMYSEKGRSKHVAKKKLAQTVYKALTETTNG